MFKLDFLFRNCHEFKKSHEGGQAGDDRLAGCALIVGTGHAIKVIEGRRVGQGRAGHGR